MAGTMFYSCVIKDNSRTPGRNGEHSSQVVPLLPQPPLPHSRPCDLSGQIIEVKCLPGPEEYIGLRVKLPSTV